MIIVIMHISHDVAAGRLAADVAAGVSDAVVRATDLSQGGAQECPAGCEDGYCAYVATQGGYYCQKCLNKLLVRKSDGLCGRCGQLRPWGCSREGGVGVIERAKRGAAEAWGFSSQLTAASDCSRHAESRPTGRQAGRQQRRPHPSRCQ